MKIIKPTRATRTYIQHLAGEPAAVFPLLCPVREAEWIEAWDPPLVISSSGLAEPDCVFTTSDRPTDAIWYITRHDPRAGFVEMLKITPQVTACRLTIQLRGVTGGCEADVTYSHTSLGSQGDEFVASFTEAFYREFMQDWESRLNHYLRHGTAMQAHMKKSAAPGGDSAAALIDERISGLGDWRGETLARMRKLILEANPGVVEEWKWGGPVWSCGGIICTGETYKTAVKLTFARGAFVKDPARLFNASLDGNVRRAIDIRQGETVDAAAFKALIRAAIAANT